MKNWITVSLIFGITLLLSTACAFDFGKLADKIEEAQMKRGKPKESIRTVEKQIQRVGKGKESATSGGLIRPGADLGLIEKKNSGRLQKGAGVYQGLQPIQWEEEKIIGTSFAAEIFNRYGGSFKDERLLRYVNLVGQSVARLSDRADINYHFAILNVDQPHAFAAPGGYVFVSIGLIRLIQNEAHLAGVLGHEIAHISKKHALQTIELNRRLQDIGDLSMVAMNQNSAKLNRLLDTMTKLIFIHGLDKELEFEADRLGTLYATRVGYHPNGLKDFIRILGATATGQPSIFFSTHPSPKERYKVLVKSLAEIPNQGKYAVLTERYRKLARERL